MVELDRIYQGNCLDVTKVWPKDFIDTIITDPPYGLEFMGKGWDKGVPGGEYWKEFLSVTKPGGMLLAFGGTRTFHRMTCAIEDAGWEIRDCMMWLYGSGFPKSHNMHGKFEGWGTALKPAWEPIIVAMKPLDGTFAENAEAHGVAGLNVDGGRILTDETLSIGAGKMGYHGADGSNPGEQSPKGRWPANLILDEEAGAMLDEQSGRLTSGARSGQPRKNKIFLGDRKLSGGFCESSSGGASRFFYCAKASKSERNAGCDGLPEVAKPLMGEFKNNPGRSTPKSIPMPRANHHPTVKPLKLMEYLCTLTKTPTGGVVLDPFAGSGTTLLAAKNTERHFIGIEMNPEYIAIADKRLLVQSQLRLASI